MSIIKYTAFLKIVELGSYSAAAKILGYSQPGIHHMITSLEQELGYQLLTNSGKKIIPTPFGASILNYAEQITKNADLIKQTISMMPDAEKVLTIGSYNSMLISLVPEILSSFSKKHTEISFRIKEFIYNECLTSISNQEVDLCFMADACPGGYEFVPLLKDPVLLVMQKSHPLTSFDKVPIKELNGKDVYMYEAGSDDTIATVMQKERFTPANKFSISTDTAVLELIRMCGGVGVLSSLDLAKLTNDLTFRPLEANIHRNLGIVYKSTNKLNPITADFIKTAQDVSKIFCKKNGLEPL